MAVGQGRGARVGRRQKGDTAMENERAISVGRSDAGDGVARKSADIDGEGRVRSMMQRGESAVYL